MKPVSIQLYTLRERAEKDFFGVLKQVADIGYLGVEPAGTFGINPKEVRRYVEELGMVVSSNHQPWPNEDNLNEVIDVAGSLGTRTVICGFGPDDFKDMDTIKKTAETTNFIVENLNTGGLAVALHNHYWEFDTIDGRLKYDIFIDMCPNLLCEVDTYWAANFGAVNPTEVVAKYASRAPLLHIKDGPLIKDELQTPVGSGKMNISSVIKAADENVLDWIIVEMDNCDRDMLQGVKESYEYLVSNGLAKGRK